MKSVVVYIQSEFEHDQLTKYWKEQGISTYKVWGKEKELCLRIDSRGEFQYCNKEYYEDQGFRILSLNKYFAKERVKREFKVGDPVKLVSEKYTDCKSNPLWGGIEGKVQGNIREIRKTCGISRIYVDWENKRVNDYNPEDLELIPEEPKPLRIPELDTFHHYTKEELTQAFANYKQTNQPTDETISQRVKRMLNEVNDLIKRTFKEDYRLQYQAMYIDKRGELTGEGEDLQAELLRELVNDKLTEKAKEKIARETKENK